MADRDLTQRGMENKGEGTIDKLKGKVKDALGGLTGDRSTQAEGKFDQAKGNVKEGLGDAQQRIDRNL
jgi:uncharacterized protein YjbJ (UPF0337 family)